MQRVRDGFDRAQVGGDVLAFRAVAAGRTFDETAVLVGQADRQAVDLGFRDEGEWLWGFTLSSIGTAGNIRRSTSVFPTPAALKLSY